MKSLSRPARERAPQECPSEESGADAVEDLARSSWATSARRPSGEASDAREGVISPLRPGFGLRLGHAPRTPLEAIDPALVPAEVYAAQAAEEEASAAASRARVQARIARTRALMLGFGAGGASFMALIPNLRSGLPAALGALVIAALGAGAGRFLAHDRLPAALLTWAGLGLSALALGTDPSASGFGAGLSVMMILFAWGIGATALLAAAVHLRLSR